MYSIARNIARATEAGKWIAAAGVAATVMVMACRIVLTADLQTRTARNSQSQVGDIARSDEVVPRNDKSPVQKLGFYHLQHHLHRGKYIFSYGKYYMINMWLKM
jgi:hypothetical protein